MKPNIIWLTLDHIAFRHRQVTPELVRMPTYDRLCREGVEFVNAQSVCPICQPARASMLTGQYPHQHGMVLNDGNSGSARRFSEGTELISGPLGNAGYQAAYFGKWHAGGPGASGYGFEGWSPSGYGYPYGTEAYADYLNRHGLTLPEVKVDWDKLCPENEGKTLPLEGEFGPFNAAGVLTGPQEVHEAYFVADLAVDWLRNRDNPQPFFLRADIWGPHHPYHSAGDFAGTVDPESIPEYPSFRRDLSDLPLCYLKSRRRNFGEPPPDDWSYWQKPLARCYEQIALVDDALGRIVDTLDTLGLTENTVVIYTADHGDLLGAHGGLFNKDAVCVNETMSIPMAIRWPREISPGTQRPEFVSNMDLMPTVLEIAGASIPEAVSGESLLALGKSAGELSREVLVCENFGCFCLDTYSKIVFADGFKYIAYADDIDELYDLRHDPFELTNLAGDPRFTHRMQTMAGHALRHVRTSGETGRECKRFLSKMAKLSADVLRNKQNEMEETR